MGVGVRVVVELRRVSFPTQTSNGGERETDRQTDRQRERESGTCPEPPDLTGQVPFLLLHARRNLDHRRLTEVNFTPFPTDTQIQTHNRFKRTLI